MEVTKCIYLNSEELSIITVGLNAHLQNLLILKDKMPRDLPPDLSSDLIQKLIDETISLSCRIEVLSDKTS